MSISQGQLNPTIPSHSEEHFSTPLLSEQKKNWWSVDTEQLKQYGKVGIITHLAMSWSFLAFTYFLVSKTNQGGKIIKLLKLEERIPKSAGSFVIAGIIYKVIMPARIALSLVTIPLVIKAFDIHTDPVEEIRNKKEEEILSQGGIWKENNEK